jgi:hypothetical protein
MPTNQLHLVPPEEADGLDCVPDLPRTSERRWTVRRKAAVIQAVRGGWIPIEEVCRVYGISVDEFVAWERDLDQYGVPGLRTTRYQIYRNIVPRERKSRRRTGPNDY